MIKEVNDVGEILDENFVLIVKLGMRAPCRRLINECRNACAELEGINFYIVDYVGPLKESLKLGTVPAIVVFKNRVEVEKREGWYITMPHVVDLVKRNLG